MTNAPEEKMEEITIKMEEMTEETAAANEQQDTGDTIESETALQEEAQEVTEEEKPAEEAADAVQPAATEEAEAVEQAEDNES